MKFGSQLVFWLGIAFFASEVKTRNVDKYGGGSSVAGSGDDHLARAQRMFGRIDGDFIVGALFPVHEQPMLTGEGKPLECGLIRETYGIHRVEAAFQTIDLINQDPDILPDVKLGIEIRDECWNAPVAVHQTLKLIYESVEARQTLCNYSGSLEVCRVRPLIGVLGPGASSVSVQVYNLLQLFDIPQISYSSTSHEFSNKAEYGYFLRVVPSDRYQAQAIIDLIKYFTWTYVSIVYTDDNYGRSGVKILKKLIEESDICISREEGIISNSHDKRYDELMGRLVTDKRVNVVVLFCEGLTVKGLLASAKRNNLSNRFLFIGTDGWAGREDIVRTLEESAQGNIMIRVYSPPVATFDRFYRQLNPRTNVRNPWFNEFWQFHFNCSLSDHRANFKKDDYTLQRCTGAEELTSEYDQDPKLSLVVKAIYAFAHALHNMLQKDGDCKGSCSKSSFFNNSRFLEYLKNVSFTYNNETVYFDANGDVPARYDILNYQKLLNGKYEYVKIGSWSSDGNRLSMFENIRVQFPGNLTDGIVSVCSEPCKPGYYQDFGGNDKRNCCWICVRCANDQVSDGGAICRTCNSTFQKPNSEKTECERIAIKYVKWTDAEGLISIIFACIGIGLTFAVAAIFLMYNQTPVVKSSTKELCYIMLIGMFLSHCSTFFVIGLPNQFTCTMIASGMLIVAELLISILMINLEPAAVQITITDGVAVQSCNTTARGVFTPMMLNIALTLACTYYAFKTRKLPQNFNEAKYIGFAMYASFVTWIAFGLVYFNSSLKRGVGCLFISMHALIVLIFLFCPKVYIILFKPERNDRSHFLTTVGLRCHFGLSFSRCVNLIYDAMKSRSTIQALIPQMEFVIILLWWLGSLAAADYNNTTGSGESEIGTGSERKAAMIKGDFMIGVLLPIHERPMIHGTGDPMSCGLIREEFGIHRTEAALYAIDKINRDKILLPHVTIGVDIRDGCWNSVLSLQQTIKLIENSVPDEEDDSDEDGTTCAKNNNDTVRPLIGILGPGPSDATIQVQNLLQLFHISQIGYSATSADLSDKNRYGYFFRVVPPDSYQVFIMFELLQYYQWTYISLLYTEGNYGESGAKLFQDYLKYFDVCISMTIQIATTSRDIDYWMETLQELNKDVNVNVIVCFCDGLAVEKLMEAVKSLNYTNRFVFIGSDSWAGRRSLLTNVPEQMEGNLAVGIDLQYSKEFDSYYLTRTPNNNKRNPWFNEFWQMKFNCTFNTTSLDQRSCSGDENLRLDYHQDSKVSAIIKAIYVLAHALDHMIADVCPSSDGHTCPNMYPFDGVLFKKYIAATNFTYLGEEVSFDEDYDPVAQYVANQLLPAFLLDNLGAKIFNYQKLKNGTYSRVHIGSWKRNFTLDIWREAIFDSSDDRPVESVCSQPCQPGFYKNAESQGVNKECCWLCIPCDENEILLNETYCEACNLGFWPNVNQTACEKIIIVYVKWDDIQSIVSVIVAYVGIILTVIMAIFFYKYGETPIVKSSTKELCYMMLFGMCIAHCTTFAVISKPSYLSCTISRIIPGVSFAIVYGSLLAKTNRIARILAISKKKFPNMKPRFMSTAAQIWITSGIIILEVVICIFILVLEPAAPELHFPDIDRSVLRCNTSDRALVVPLLFDGLLVLLCTLYAVKTRNIPANFNEAKFIGFSMYTTCITWVAFGLIYYGSKLKVVTQCVSISVNSIIILVILFFPKLYIMLIRPDKNTRANFTTTKGIRCFIGNVPSSTSQSTRSYLSSNSSEMDRVQISQHPNGNNGGLKTKNITSTGCQTSAELLRSLLAKDEEHVNLNN